MPATASPSSQPQLDSDSSRVDSQRTAVALAGVISPGGKPGYQTTEFQITAVLILLDLLGTIFGMVPGQWAVTAATITGVAYKAARTLQKLYAESFEIGVPQTLPIELHPKIDALREKFGADLGQDAQATGEAMPEMARTPVFKDEAGSTEFPIVSLLCWLAALALVAFSLAGCATSTVLYGADLEGKARKELVCSADVDQLDYASGTGKSLHLVNHRPSVSTLAHGTAVSHVIQSTGAAVATGATAVITHGAVK